MKLSDIYRSTAKILRYLEATHELSSTKKTMSVLRTAAGGDMLTTMPVWGTLFPLLPKGNPDYDIGALTQKETAILHALSLYALHQQARPYSVWDNPPFETLEKKWPRNIGRSLATLRGLTSKSDAVDRRFGALLTSTDVAELAQHLRYMIAILRQKTRTTVNYPQLAHDLFFYSCGYDDSVRASWAKSYFTTPIQTNEGDA